MVVDELMRRLKQRYMMRGVKASITVETTLVMPLILACIMLLIIMNGYLHDMVVLDAISVEVLYSEGEEKEKIFYEESQHRVLWLQNVDFSETEDVFKQHVIWKKTYSLPLKGLLSFVIGETEIDLSGDVQKQSWSMPQIIRYIKQN